MRLLLTHGTATGRAEGQATAAGRCAGLAAVGHARGGGAVFAALSTPHRLADGNRLAELGRRLPSPVVPLALVNARLSDKSQRQAQRLAWLARPAYAALTAVWAQTEADAQRACATWARRCKACLAT